MSNYTYEIPELVLPGRVATVRRSYEEYYSIGDALEAANHERQTQKAKEDLRGAEAQLEYDWSHAKANLERSTTARGFGRSSYTTDSLLYADQVAIAQKQSLLDGFNQTLLYLDAQRHSNAANYAAKQIAAQDAADRAAAQYNAEVSNMAALKMWEAQLEQLKNMQYVPETSSSSSKSSSKSKSSSSKSSGSANGTSSSSSSTTKQNTLNTTGQSVRVR